MLKKDNVAIVTVTYNSSAFLRRLVEAAAKQTEELKRVIVVDNASNSDNKKAIAALAEEYSLLEVLVSEENLGGAGGFEKGVQYVRDTYPETDWVWLMDDDAFPREGCLEKLLEYKDLQNVGCLAPMIFGVDLQKFQFFHHKTVGKYLNNDIAVGERLEDFQDVTELKTNAFVGPLIKMEVVREIGIPDGALFIYGDDTEYIYRISQKYQVYLIKDAIMNHRDIVNDNNIINPKNFWKDYYKYRNRFLFIGKYKKNRWSGIIGKVLVAKNLLREYAAVSVKKKYAGHRKKKLYCLRKALWDGITGKTGKTLNPVDFMN